MFAALVVSLALAGSPAPEIACVPWVDGAAVCRVGPEGTGAIVHVPAEAIRLSAEEMTVRALARVIAERGRRAADASPAYRQVGEPRRKLKGLERVLRIAAWVSVPVIVVGIAR